MPSFIAPPPCEFALSKTSKIYDFYRIAARQYQNVRIVDLSSSICPDDICRGEHDNIVIFRDSNHLTASFVSSLENILAEQIDCALGVAKESRH
jgi:hypothetical protein